MKRYLYLSDGENNILAVQDGMAGTITDLDTGAQYSIKTLMEQQGYRIVKSAKSEKALGNNA